MCDVIKITLISILTGLEPKVFTGQIVFQTKRILEILKGGTWLKRKDWEPLTWTNQDVIHKE
ncbi:hypothetical protein WN51_08761 [Melipona quadrifasciata]|uniref:Uncharacterized protein n=1 Tax=Melipona quadrifasciata TaxID=166423 RepID=A0A0M8ZQ17_9HYME|nr:hypothetical protein WN51_08761 [Melipona quadrifasciata]